MLDRDFYNQIIPLVNQGNRWTLFSREDFMKSPYRNSYSYALLDDIELFAVFTNDNFLLKACTVYPLTASALEKTFERLCSISSYSASEILSRMDKTIADIIMQIAIYGNVLFVESIEYYKVLCPHLKVYPSKVNNRPL